MEIRTAGEEILRRQAKPVKHVSRQVRRWMEEMMQTMYASKGIGLAAPQVGISKRIIVADVGDGPVMLANPELIAQSGQQLGLEGCLSVPGLVGEVERAAAIRITGWDHQDKQVWIDAEGLMSRCLQHEMDHLNGVLFTDIAIRVMPKDSVTDRQEVLD